MDVKTPNQPAIYIPQNTGFYASFFNSLFVPSISQAPVPETDDGLWDFEDEWSDVTSRITEGSRPALAEENPDDYAEEWVDVERELGSEDGVSMSVTYQGRPRK